MRTRCPACGATSSLDVLVTHEDARAALMEAFQLAGPAGVAMLRYLALWRPSKHDLTMARVAKLLGEVNPFLKAASVPRHGREWAVQPADWVRAVEQMQTARDQGKLTTPLTSHGYLLEVLAGNADKAERQAETQAEEQARNGGRSAAGTVQVNGQALSISQAIDPALARMDAERRQGVTKPPSDEIRKALAALRSRPSTTPTSNTPTQGDPA